MFVMGSRLGLFVMFECLYIYVYVTQRPRFVKKICPTNLGIYFLAISNGVLSFPMFYIHQSPLCRTFPHSEKLFSMQAVIFCLIAVF